MHRIVAAAALSLLASGAAACIDLEALGSPEGPRRVRLPEIAYLGLIAQEGQAGSHSISAYPDLPDGGVRGEHLCGTVIEVPFSRGRTLDEGLVQLVSLQLQQGVDYARAYPAFYGAVVASGQLHVAPGGNYTVHRFSKGATPGVGDAALDRLLAAGGACAGTAIAAGDTILVPDC